MNVHAFGDRVKYDIISTLSLFFYNAIPWCGMVAVVVRVGLVGLAGPEQPLVILTGWPLVVLWLVSGWLGDRPDLEEVKRMSAAQEVDQRR